MSVSLQNGTGKPLGEAGVCRTPLKNHHTSFADLLQLLGVEGADLSGANLQGADLSWADLHGATLLGAALDGAKTAGVIYCKTTMPDGSINNAGC